MTYPDTERYVYNNELISLIGFFVFVLCLVRRRLYSYSLKAFFAFIVYGLLVTIFSAPAIYKTGVYLSLRTMAVWYSIFGFFAGLMFVQVIGLQRLLSFFHRFSKVSWLLMFASPFRLTPQVLFSFGRRPTLYSYLFFVFVMGAFYLMKQGATTVTAVAFVTVVYVWANSRFFARFLNRKIILPCVSLLLFSLYFFIPTFNKFLQVGYDGFSGDNNATWRLMFWVYLFKEKFLNSPLFGLGFGTPLFDLLYAPEFLTSDDGSRNTNYTLGTHNSFFYVAIRLGFVGFSLLILSLIKIYSVAVKAYKASNCERERVFIFSLILANVMFLNSALFNVILESPLYAANFWVTLGLMYGVSLKVLRGGALR